jgi:hypothetical protein
MRASEAILLAAAQAPGNAAQAPGNIVPDRAQMATTLGFPIISPASGRSPAATAPSRRKEPASGTCRGPLLTEP